MTAAAGTMTIRGPDHGGDKRFQARAAGPQAIRGGRAVTDAESGPRTETPNPVGPGSFRCLATWHISSIKRMR